ncbi:amino acid transporter [Periconia macrospinosa]|uniref:Amino acid transporter n=1 Tax=Periconia macrospinosa TaxID=97972 RepID=A0A2V1DTI0_9PLEO|nr:amino acid transporter [Periconia macrospinosa]
MVQHNDNADSQSSQIAAKQANYTLDGMEDGDADDVYSRANPARPGFTKSDQKDMWRMGKMQELKRSYRPLSALSFAVILTAVWEFLLVANTQGLIDGGLAGVFWSYIWTFIGFGFVELSLAEMASMAPISGGQYHWVSEFAPPNLQQFLSYVVGWMSTLSWQAGNASGSFLTGTIIQSLLVVNYPHYEPQRWQGTLFVFAMVIVLCVVNIWGSEIWAKIQNGLLILHIVVFLAVIITLWVLAPHQSAKAVFTEFTNAGGWPTMGLSLMVGQITALYAMLGSDATAHMSEEVRDAGRYVPISLFWSYMGNGAMAIVLLITYLFSIDNLEAALEDPSGFPFIYVFKSAVSTAGVNALTILVLILIIAANISFNASTARQTFAFARDKGLPFSKWLSHVNPQREVPVNAIIVTCACTMLLSLINIGSNVAFNAIISLQVVALFSTYAVSISCVLYRRIKHPELVPTARWSLGRWGIPVNIVGLSYSTFSFFWAFWPNETPVTLETFNWSVVLFVGVFIISLVMYIVQGRRVYKGPVADIRASRVD